LGPDVCNASCHVTSDVLPLRVSGKRTIHLELNSDSFTNAYTIAFVRNCFEIGHNTSSDSMHIDRTLEFITDI